MHGWRLGEEQRRKGLDEGGEGLDGGEQLKH